jgi:hypothetical protein
MDPARWSRTLQVLQDLPVIECPLSASGMIPASARFKEAVENERLTHPSDEALARAIGDTRTRIDDRGAASPRTARWPWLPWWLMTWRAI